MDRILGEIVDVPLGERIRSKCSSYLQPFFVLFCFVLFFFFFFFFFVWKKMSTRHAYQWSRKNEDFSRDLESWTGFPEVRWIWSFRCAFQRPDGFDVWTCFLKVWWNWVLDVLPRGSVNLKFGCASQRSDGLKFGRAS